MTQNTQNTQNSSNAGRSTDPGSEWTFPDRDELPLGGDPGMVDDDNPPEPHSPTQDGCAPSVGRYVDAFWSPVWEAWRFLPQYLQLNWRNTNPGFPLPMPGDKPAYPGQLFSEYEELERLVEYAEFDRDDALLEIMAQKDEFISYFMGLLTATPASHPQTYRLMHLLNLIAAFTVMYWKSRYRRLRPSQVRTKLLPPVQVPGHASYPSGHSTQAHLIAYGVQLVVPAPNANLLGLAKRIARNRELAGFHYPSDSDGGESLAKNIFTMIEADRTTVVPAPAAPPLIPPCGAPNPQPDPAAAPFMTGYKYLVELAQGEWNAQPGP